ncbi:MAG TPA: PepSY-associated TM helix domain-containing protein [Burkholderiaceae bacterium]
MTAGPHSSNVARRAPWLKTLHQWHWISSALCLIGMVLFAFTGITLNHASDIESTPVVSQRTAQLPADLLTRLKPAGGAGKDQKKTPLPPPVRQWLAGSLDIALDAREAEWSADEVYLSLPRPGGDAWLRIDLETGGVEYERTDRGWISYLNDLHKGRHAGVAWSWFIDIFSVACLVFSISGLLILKFHATNRPSTWPLVAAGLVLPALLALLLVH